jgi:hypothetical protein
VKVRVTPRVYSRKLQVPLITLNIVLNSLKMV